MESMSASPKPKALGNYVSGDGRMDSTAARPARTEALASVNGNDSDHAKKEASESSIGSIPRFARVIVFIFICQGVQMFMSYDGGAVPASLDTLQEEMEDSWSQFEIGLLGAMDKIGMVVMSVPWGWALGACNAKLLLTLSLCLNAGCTIIFGSLRTKSWMYAAKFAMGATQSLQGVWGTVWTVNMAPLDRKTMWLGLGAVSAGIGNGIGTSVAGFGTANGLPYAFAFQLAGIILVGFWIVLVFLPSRWLRMQIHPEEDNLSIRQREERNVALEEPERTLSEQLSTLLANRVYVWTTFAISLGMFQVSGIQYLWTRMFVTVWSLDKNWVTLMFILVTGCGGGLGIAFGPWFIDRHGGFHQPTGVVRTLRIIFWFQFVAALAGGLGVYSLYGRMHWQREANEWGDVWLWLSWASIFLIYMAHNSCVAALCGINIQVIPGNTQTFASGTEMTVRNVLGYICGPLLPSIVMSLNSGFDERWELSIGLGFMYLTNLLGIVLLGGARAAASKDLDKQRRAALSGLRAAFQAEDVLTLEQAVTRAKVCNLQKWKDGEAVIGMANEVIGQYHAHGITQRELVLVAATHDELRERALALEEKLKQQNAMLTDYEEEVKQLRSALSTERCRDCQCSQVNEYYSV